MLSERTTGLLASFALIVLSACVSAPVLAAEGPFVHEQMLRSHEGLAPITASDVGFPTAAQLANRGRSDGPIVMGYLPYWVSAENLPWQHLDVLAWFSAEVNADGSLEDTHGWGGSGSDGVLSIGSSPEEFEIPRWSYVESSERDWNDNGDLNIFEVNVASDMDGDGFPVGLDSDDANPTVAASCGTGE